MIKYMFFYAAMLFMMNSCSLSVTDEIKLENVSYGPHDRMVMDVFLPVNRNNETPFVILIHGGGWIAGDKSWMSDIQGYLLSKGIASANINYRYADSMFNYKNLLTDIDASLTFCEKNMKKWGIPRSDFVVCGNSAGGHLALLLAYTTTKKINSVIAFCPITDLTDSLLISQAQKTGLRGPIEYISGNLESERFLLTEVLQQASPLYNVKDIPTLLIHGTFDQTVPYTQSERLHKTLQQKNYINKLLSVRGAGHDLDIYRSTSARERIYGETVKWIHLFNQSAN